MTRRRRSRKSKLAVAPPSSASSEPEVHPNATLGPDASLESSQAQWLGSDSTNAPLLGEEQEDQIYASGGFEFLERFLRGRVGLQPRSVFLIITIAWFVFISWLYVRDNELARLDTIDGMKWFGVKIAIYSVIYFVVAIIVLLSSQIGRPSR